MEKNEISFNNLPQAMAHLVNEVETIKSLVENSQAPAIKKEKIPIGIDEACKLIGKAKSTVYTLVRKRIIPSYKNGKQLYFFEDELVEWIKNGRRKTLEEIHSESQIFVKGKRKKQL